MPTSSFSLFVFLLSCNLLPLVRAATTTACPGDCSGHGMCNSATTHCDCYAGYMGHACDLRACPTGIRWIGMASGTDTLHETLVECSGVGKCDRRSGLCKCSLPYSGRGCERVGCPDTSTGLTPCNGNGMCVSLKQLASIKDDIHFFNTYTYNSLWDAEKLWGCVCDYGYTGNDCSQRTCPMGDDPLATSGSATVDSQRYTCAGTSGYFVAKIFGFVTEQIAYNANAATVKAALEALPPIRGVSVSFSSGSVVCASGTITTTIQWTHTPGDVPQLSFPVNTANIAYASLSVDGTSTSEECSGRGLCTRTGANQGLCTCETGFSSSNGASTNTAGDVGDCSRVSATPSTCTMGSSTDGTTVCSGHGVCSSASSGSATYRRCSCANEWTGYGCSLRKCKVGKAWWDEPSSNDVAHDWAECSNRGQCDRAVGLCKCFGGNTGAACQFSICPIVSGDGVCNGKGRCMTLKRLNTYRTVNGVSAALVYGSDPSSAATWDADLLKACLCDTDRFSNDVGGGTWTTVDCYERECPRGDDPETMNAVTGYHLKEIQKITCIGTGGTFKLGFRGETTVAIDWNANANGVQTLMAGTGTVTYGSATLATTSNLAASFAAGDVVNLTSTHLLVDVTRTFVVSSDSSSTIVMTEPIGLPTGTLYEIYKLTTSVESALEGLNTIDDVTVGLASGSAICTTNGQPTAPMTITFNTEHSDVPNLVITSSVTGTSAGITLTTPQTGTTEDEECSLHGKCDRDTGVCKCDTLWTSSDGSGKHGNKGDCGAFASVLKFS